MLNGSITTTYKKAINNIKKKINAGRKQVLRNKSVWRRMQTNMKNYFISLKDHKENFQKNPTVRLINPVKNKFGDVCKVILDKIKKSNQENLQLNHWKNTGTAID